MTDASGDRMSDQVGDLSTLIGAFTEGGVGVAVAESLTGGLVLARLTDVPGAGDVVRGGVVAYAPEIKNRVLGVDRGRLESEGPVDPQVALQMARGVRSLLGADVGVATTGEAGPESATGRPVGLFYVAVVTPTDERVQRHFRPGTRDDVRRAAVQAALGLLWSVVQPGSQAPRP